MMKSNYSRPNYKAIYNDILKSLASEVIEKTAQIMSKDQLSISDVIRLNNLIFSNETRNNNNQKFRSYDKVTILEILEFQKKNGYNNSEVAQHFKLSRNSVAKWKKTFSI